VSDRKNRDSSRLISVGVAGKRKARAVFAEPPDQESRLRLTATDMTAAAAKSASDHLRRLAQQAGQSFQPAIAASRDFERAVERTARNTGRPSRRWAWVAKANERGVPFSAASIASMLAVQKI
jgi:hypothetical protein